jgi:hypothetical protein
MFIWFNSMYSRSLFRVMMFATISAMKNKNDVRIVFSSICVVGFMFYLFSLYLFTYTGVQHDFHIKCYSYRVAIPRRVPLIEQESRKRPAHQSALQFLIRSVLLNLMCFVDNGLCFRLYYFIIVFSVLHLTAYAILSI